MKSILFLSTLLAISATALAQPQKDIQNIERLCGCYSVNFKYAETFSPLETYKYHDREEMNATELALPVTREDGKVVIQHLLIVQDTMVIKHWREEWVYQPAYIYDFKGSRTWQKRALSADESKGKWLQTVWEVSDEPRYQGLSAWIENDGKTYWESTADAPLPRREYTVRNDYQIMRRHNRIALTADGYVHEQDNDKIIKNAAVESVLVQEKGFNTYYRVEDKECANAVKWWQENEPFWVMVRKDWQNIVAANETLTVKATIDEKPLNEHLTMLWKEWRKNKIASTEISKKINDLLRSFL